MISYFQPLDSMNLIYILISISAQSIASVPPWPECTEIIAPSSSCGPEKYSSNSNFSILLSAEDTEPDLICSAISPISFTCLESNASSFMMEVDLSGSDQKEGSADSVSIWA